ncbi:50S ribosomal protein L25 [Neosynechococcus sphagnicola sy1]|uniref:50S ribosomal protein L25 n=1 Tax=Neosynechococcus sphagnicola sy1 TaxID=1497020 RepID=A0A098TMD6_9CYAN|nr:50S ribosomal protein L25 [Neosynechococcus sphagnicola]KGF73022.1 50S ribosomal protein L25 [Neosynechococcus sphagnicola sy1]
MELTIECQKRAVDSKPNALRRSGLIPAVLYGHNGVESLELTVAAKAAEFLVRDAVVKKSRIQVSIPELSWSGQAVLQEVHAHPANRSLYHLSFFAVPS